ncbi:unnamed protein product [Pleuronectes platessa]|uniref:Uncharacterized protein n=1 Tax=Pleuronectes platessa TaxID=8262 RepID=A0A9N7VIE2_PLEPL|nr:unnamed protein product [Pleuronectes platessa]
MFPSVVLVLSLFVLLVDGDLDSNDVGIHATSTDKDSTSDEAPTQSMNAISPDQPDEAQYVGGGPSDASSSSTETADAPAANQVTAPEPGTAATNSVEDTDDDKSSESEERGKKRFSSRSAKSQSAPKSQQPPPHVDQSPALLPNSPARVILSPALPPQPIIPQPKALYLKLVWNVGNLLHSSTNQLRLNKLTLTLVSRRPAELQHVPPVCFPAARHPLRRLSGCSTPR